MMIFENRIEKKKRVEHKGRKGKLVSVLAGERERARRRSNYKERRGGESSDRNVRERAKAKELA